MKITKGCFSTFPHLMCKGLPAYEQITFIWLFHHANAEGVCFPSINTLAEECGISRDSIKRSLKSLEDRGYIGREERKRDDGGNTSNIYTVYFLDCSNSTEGVANSTDTPQANTTEGEANSATNYNQLTKTNETKLKSLRDTPISNCVDDSSLSCEDVQNLFNEILGNVMPKVQEMHRVRSLTLRARFPKLSTIEQWRDLFIKIKASDFLCGRTLGKDGKPFACSFDWIIKEENFIRILEGNYDKKIATTTPQNTDVEKFEGLTPEFDDKGNLLGYRGKRVEGQATIIY